MTTPLTLITMLARAGALGRAWAMFRVGGYAARTDDAGILAVKGRLLKDQGLRAVGDERAALFKAAAEAYRAADALSPEPWLLINMATLTLLAGDGDAAAGLAAKVLARLDQAGDALAETPYFRHATRAEAALLHGDKDAAAAAMDCAVAADPSGWSDRASTLRQFGLILAAQGSAPGWLDRWRPPRSLHFAGHMAVSGAQPHPRQAEVERWLEQEAIGFGYGALAAGADILIAEAVLARGAELHVVLPAAQEAFRTQSVSPYGPGWSARYDACLARASSVRIAARVAGPYEPLATALAAELAMGAAMLNARQLESEAVQLLILDDGPGPYGGGAGTARDGASWAASGARQHRMIVPRETGITPSNGKHEGLAARSLAALVRLDVEGLSTLDEAAMADFLHSPLGLWLSGDAGHAAQSDGQHWLWTCDTAGAALDLANAALAQPPPEGLIPTVSLHYGLIHRIGAVAAGPPLVALDRVARRAIAGTLTASADFATILALDPGQNAWRAEFVGDYERPDGTAERLFALQMARS